MTIYTIKHTVVRKPEVELPEGSQVVSIKYTHDLEFQRDSERREAWEIVWLEPKTDTGEKKR